MLRKMSRIWIVQAVLISWLALALMALQGDFESLEQLLIWVVGGGGAMAVAGAFVALFLENLAFWHGLPVAVKTIVPLLLAAALGFVASSVLNLGLLAHIPANVQMLLLVLINWLSSQFVYMRSKNANYGAG